MTAMATGLAALGFSVAAKVTASPIFGNGFWIVPSGAGAPTGRRSKFTKSVRLIVLSF
jgi:hypothetical protein